MSNRLRRLWHSMRLTLARGPRKKKAYADKHGLFALFGENVIFQPKTVPLYSELIKLHDGVTVGRNVEFVCHDMIHRNYNRSSPPSSFSERVGCIEVMDNSFIGNGAIVMYDVRIAENNIIAAGSVVTKSTEPNSVYAGVPAKKIGAFDASAAKRKAMEEAGRIPTVQRNQSITQEEIRHAWDVFDANKDERAR